MRTLLLVLSVVAFFILVRVGLLGGASSDGLSQVRLVLEPEPGLHFVAWNSASQLNSDSDVITGIADKSVGAWASLLVGGAVTSPPQAPLMYEILRSDGSHATALLRSLSTPSWSLQFDFAKRWSIPVMILSFLICGCWLYIKRPYEPTSLGMLILGGAVAVYQFFQPFARQVIDFTQPQVFWYGQLVSTISGCLILAALINIGWDLPRAGASVTQQIRWGMLAVYVLTPTLFLAWQALRYFRTKEQGATVFAWLYGWQQDWQLTQSLLLLASLCLVIYQYVRSHNASQRATIRSLILGAAPIVTFLLVSEKAFLLVGLQPPLDDNIRRAASIFLPFLIMTVVMRHRVFSIQYFADKSIAFAAAFMAAFVSLILAGALIVGMLRSGSEALVFSILFAVLYLLGGTLIGRIRDGLVAVLYGRRLDTRHLVRELEGTFEPGQPPEDALGRCVKAIQAHFDAKFVSIVLDRPADANLGSSTIVSTAGTLMHPTGRGADFSIHVHQNLLGYLRIEPQGDALIDAVRDKPLIEPLLDFLGHVAYALKSTEQLRVSHALVREQEYRRMKLELSLHDHIAADLAGLALMLSREAKQTQSESLAEIASDLRLKSEAARSLAKSNLVNRPIDVVKFGLTSAMRRSLDQKVAVATVDVDFRISDGTLPTRYEDAIYSIANTAFDNITRHAKASKVTAALFRVTVPADGVMLVVEDNGCGVSDMASAGVGTISAHQRAAELQGRVHVENLTPSGTRLSVWLPAMDSGDSQ